MLEYSYSITYKGLHNRGDVTEVEANLLDFLDAADTPLTAAEVIEGLGEPPDNVAHARQLLDDLNRRGMVLKVM